jgi:hypothetical protein
MIDLIVCTYFMWFSIPCLLYRPAVLRMLPK